MHDLISNGTLFGKLEKLNPNANLRLEDGFIFSSVAGELLVLPETFYYNEKNGITNKHRTKSGCYSSIPVVIA